MTDNDRTNVTDSMPVFTPAEAAQRLGVSERTIWRQIRSGKLEKIEASGRTFVRLTSNSDTDTKAGRSRDNDSDKVSVNEVELLKDTIKRQETEIIHLRENDKANQARIREFLILIDSKDRRYQELEQRHEETLKSLPVKGTDTVTDTPVNDEIKAIMQTHTELYNQLRSSKRVIWPWIVAGAAVLVTIAVVIIWQLS